MNNFYFILYKSCVKWNPNLLGFAVEGEGQDTRRHVFIGDTKITQSNPDIWFDFKIENSNFLRRLSFPSYLFYVKLMISPALTLTSPTRTSSEFVDFV